MNAETKVEAASPDNLAIWNAVSKTDPAHTKQFKRAGGFQGTAIKPMWIIHRLTEQFGPCGMGWGMDAPSFQVVPGDNREVLVFCTVAGWYDGGEDGVVNRVYGVGGDKVVTHVKANEQYKRPERWENDDEAFKKAFTDAVNNAFKFIGVGADIHMGQFDDSKYVQQVRQEFADAQAKAIASEPVEPAARTKLDGPHGSKTALRGAVHEVIAKVRAATSDREITAIVKEAKSTIDQAAKDWPALINGDPNIEEDVGLRGAVENARAALREDGQLSTAIRSMKETETIAQLTSWMASNESLVDELDDPDRRKFELARDLHESGLMQVSLVNT